MLMPTSQRGLSVVELLLTCALIAMVSAMTVPMMHASREHDEARMAARYMANRLHLLRLQALKRNAAVAMRFDPVDLGRVAEYIDGDGDGVRQADVDQAIDPALGQPHHLSDRFGDVRFRILDDLPEPDGGAILAADSDPLRIGSTNFLSFHPAGSSTSGTVYLAGASGAQTAVRVMGATGRVRVLTFNRATRQWREE
jgi:hypothetical protein